MYQDKPRISTFTCEIRQRRVCVADTATHHHDNIGTRAWMPQMSSDEKEKSRRKKQGEKEREKEKRKREKHKKKEKDKKGEKKKEKTRAVKHIRTKTSEKIIKTKMGEKI